MLKQVVLLGVGFLGFSFPLAAQQTNETEEPGGHAISPVQSRQIAMFDPVLPLSLYRPGIPGAPDNFVLLPDRPELTLLDGGDLLAEMGMAPLVLFPVASSDVTVEQNVNDAPIRRSARKDSGRDGKDSLAEVVSRPLSPIYYGGELGVFYGRWSGKYSGDVMQTYIQGDIGNEKFHISAGATYEESNVDLPGPRSFPRSR
jgi:hypothetical protein